MQLKHLKFFLQFISIVVVMCVSCFLFSLSREKCKFDMMIVADDKHPCIESSWHDIHNVHALIYLPAFNAAPGLSQDALFNMHCLICTSSRPLLSTNHNKLLNIAYTGKTPSLY